MKYCNLSLVTLISCVPFVDAFAPSLGSNRVKTSLQVSVDPKVVTKKEYEDICGVNFDEESLDKRLERTSFLYPKHVEVVEDLGPMVDRMVDEIVSHPLSRIICFKERTSLDFSYPFYCPNMNYPYIPLNCFNCVCALVIYKILVT